MPRQDLSIKKGLDAKKDLAAKKGLVAKKDLDVKKDLTIKKADLSDLDDLFKLECDGSVRPYSYAVTKDILLNSTVLVALYCGQMAGYAAASIVFEDADIINIVVKNDLRGRGVGKALLSALINECRQQGVKRLLLEVETTNSAALGLYEGLKFRQISTRDKYYGEGSAIIMESRLD